MVRIERKTQKIFATNSSSSSITAFGTAKNTNPTQTRDVDLIQTEAYTYGWSPSLVSDLAPFLTDSNALHYATTKQLAYIFQEGIPEYDAGTEYGIGSLVKVTTGAYVNIYKSIKNDNINHAVSNTEFWSLYISDSNMAHYPIGDLRMSLSNKVLANEIILNGAVVSRTTYKSLFDIFGTTYGAGDGSTTFKLPDFTNRTVWGTTSSFGYVTAGLPNLEGYIYPVLFGNARTDTAKYIGTKWDRDVSNLFKRSKTGVQLREEAKASGKDDSTLTYGCQGGQDNVRGQQMSKVELNASDMNPIYGSSSTVQPPAIKVIFKTRWY